MASLTGKTALVTGASRGIGRAIAQRLAADGALVAVHYGSNDAAAAETIDAIRAAGGEAFGVRAQLGVDGDVDALFAALEGGLDGRPLDILVNNAAIATNEATIDTATPEQFDREFAINVRAPLFITQRALPLLHDGGRIINISSGVTWIAAGTLPDAPDIRPSVTIATFWPRSCSTPRAGVSLCSSGIPLAAGPW